MADNDKKRIEFLDIAKGIAVILMVIGHTPGLYKPLRELIFSFHMPVFFLLAGYTFKLRNFKDVFINSFKRLLVPYFITQGIRLAIYTLRLYIDVGNTIFAKNTYTLPKQILGVFWANGIPTKFFTSIPSAGCVWFLTCLFVARLMFNGLLKANKWVQCVIVLIISAVGMLLHKIALPFNISVAMVALIFMWIGYLVRNIDLKQIKWCYWLIFIGLWLLYIPFGHIELAMRSYPYNFLSVLTACCGSLVFIRICIVLERYKALNKIFTFFGRNSLLLLCCHNIEGYIFNLTKFAGTITESKLVSALLCGSWKFVIALIMLFTVISINKIYIRRPYSETYNC